MLLTAPPISYIMDAMTKNTNPTAERLPPKERTEQLLDAALRVAARHGLAQTTRAQIAEAAGVSPALVSHHLGTMEAMRRSVMRRAIATETLPVIAEGLLARDKFAMKASPELRQRAIASIQA